MRFLFLLIISELICQKSIAQSVTPLTAADKKNYVLTINEKDIRKHEVLHRKNQSPQKGWLLTVRLHNNSNDTLKYVTMSCSWDDNFRLSNNKLQIKSWGCDSNFPITKSIPPHKAVSFDITVICPDTLAKVNTDFKVGMIIIKDNKDDDVLNGSDNMNRFSKNLIWSNPVKIPK